LKYGSIDILLDCGVNGKVSATTNKKHFSEDLKKYCIDGVLDYVVVSHAQTDALSQMAKNGVIENFEITNLVDYGKNTLITAPAKGGWIEAYVTERDKGIKSGTIKNYYPAGKINGFVINDILSISFYNQGNILASSENDYSICTLVEFCGRKLLFSGDISENRESMLIDSAGDKLKNVDFYVANNFGAEGSSSSYFLEKIQPKITIVPSAAGLTMNTKSDVTSFKVCKNLVKYAKNEKDKIVDGMVYLMAQVVNGEIQTVCGDITLEILESNSKATKFSVTYSGPAKNYSGIEYTRWYNENSAA
jgi:hypothetical protein